MKNKTSLLICLLTLGLSLSLYCQPEEFSTYLNHQTILSGLQNADLEKEAPIDESVALINLPLPSGEFQNFKVLESPILGEALSAEYPEIKSYLIEAVNDKSYHGRISTSSSQITAVFYSPDGIVYIEPVDLETNMYRAYHGDKNGSSFECGVGSEFFDDYKENFSSQRISTFSNGTNLRDYDMIIATTGEFYQANGNTDAAVTAEINSIMSSINVFFENETSIRFTTVAINLLSDPNTDGLDPAGNRTADANTVISNYATANNIDFDIGHVVHTTAAGGSGVAGTGPCTSNGKARGWSGLSVTSSLFAWVELMGHEIGHQFGAAHSYYGTVSNCVNRSPGNGFEPGSGTSVMSYSGICSAHNITPVATTNYFHEHSLTQIINYANSTGTCSTNTATGNNIPSVIVPNTITIPISTPFYLRGSGTDGDGDALTFTWEQHDTDSNSYPQGDAAGDPASAATIPTAPLFRSFDPAVDGNERYFPQLSDVASGTTTQGEILSSVPRTITMRLTARDNVTGGGAFEYDDVNIMVSDVGGAFSVSTPNGGETLTAGNNTTVTWNQAGTAAYCSDVDILLSIDGGFNYPYTLASSVNNNGSATVSIPGGVPNSSLARVMVRCADNPDAYFFDISNNDFTINSACLAPGSIFANTSPLQYNQGQTIDLNVSPIYTGSINTGFTAGPFSFGTMAINGLGGTGCFNANLNHDTFEFTVDVTGNYTISQNPAICGFSVFDGFGTTCTNFLSSSITDIGGNAIGVTGASSTVSLTAGSIYTVAITNIWNPTVAFSGPGTVFSIGSLPNNYQYSYLVVDRSTNLIADVDAGADFTGLPTGIYDVYGFSYENDGSNSTAPTDVDPNTFIGQTISSVLSGGDCVTFSLNSETLEILTTGGCGISSLVISSVECNDNNTPFSSTDDFISFDLNPMGVGLSTSYNVNVSGGMLNQSTGSYGVLTSFELQTGSAGSGNLPITITDGTDASCVTTETLNDPGTCASCAAEGFDISPTASVTAAEGSSTLNLGLSPNYFNVQTSYVGTLTSASPASNLSFDDGSGVCSGPSNSNVYDVYEFYVDTDGSYTFSRTSGAFGSVINLYDDTYNPSSVCSNWLASSGIFTGQFVSLASSVTATLVTGVKYNLVMSSFSGSTPALPYNYVISGSGPGIIFDTNPLPGPYDYTYVVVNTANNSIAGFEANSDLTTYAAGSYDVYGLSYYNAANLSTYVGSSFASFQNDLSAIVICGDLSTNSINVTITGNACPPSYNVSGMENGTGNGSGGQNNNGDYETDGVIISTQSITGGTVYYDSGTEIRLEPDFNVVLGATFTAFIDGCGGAAINEDQDENTTRKKDNTESKYNEQSRPKSK